jgi:DNA/RNA endonuclease YhcR with UshA esterase domain
MKKQWYQKWWAIVFFVLVGVIIITSLLSEPKQEVKEENYAPTNPVIDVCSARNYIGKNVVLQGKVIEVSESKGTTFLNFGSRYPNHCFYGVIFSSSSSKFPQNIESYFEGELVNVRGLVEEYQGKPQIILENPEQIEIVK